MSRRAAACLLLVLAASPAHAQTSGADAPALVFGVFGGPGRRTTGGALVASALPAGAVQPAPDRTTVTFGFGGGVKLGDRVALMGVWDQTAGGNVGAGHWGTMAVHAVARVWVTRRVWVEAGGGASELGYKPPSQMSAGITRLWAPGGEASVGADVLKGPRVALTLAVRYSRATFEGLTLSRVGLQAGLISRR